MQVALGRTQQNPLMITKLLGSFFQGSTGTLFGYVLLTGMITNPLVVAACIGLIGVLLRIGFEYWQLKRKEKNGKS